MYSSWHLLLSYSQMYPSPTSFFPLVTIDLLPMFVSLFLFCIQNNLYYFLDSIYNWCHIIAFLTYLVWSLLLLSHFSRVWLCATPSLGFSRQEHWNGLPFPSPVHKSEQWKWSRSVRLSATPWPAAYQAPLSMGFSRQEDWSGVPLPSP